MEKAFHRIIIIDLTTSCSSRRSTPIAAAAATTLQVISDVLFFLKRDADVSDRSDAGEREAVSRADSETKKDSRRMMKGRMWIDGV